jgi:hypothetical protein
VNTQDKESLSHRIAFGGQHVVAVLFDERRWHCELIPLADDLPSVEAFAGYRERGLFLVGVFGFLETKFCAAFEPAIPSDSVMDYLTRCYCEFLYTKLVTHAPTKTAADVSVDWLRRLCELPAEDRSKEN